MAHYREKSSGLCYNIPRLTKISEMGNINEKNESVYDWYLHNMNDVGKEENIEKKKCEDIIQPILSFNEDKVLSIFRSLDWSFAEDETTYLSHDIHPYPAKFAPQLPAQIIKLLYLLFYLKKVCKN